MAKKRKKPIDVIVIGNGIAGCTAAMAAKKNHASTLIIEKSPAKIPHGNTAFCGGAFRWVTRKYTEKNYFQDIMKVSNGEADPLLTRITVRNSKRAKAFLSGLGMRWTSPAATPNRADSVVGKGPALTSTLHGALKKSRIPILHGTRVSNILMSNGRPVGVKVRTSDGLREIPCKAVIIATGGFQANRSMVVRYLGKGAHRLVLRGYRGSSGDGHKIASGIGASLVGMEGFHGGIIHYGYKKYPVVGQKKGMRSVKRYEEAILVNKEGKRFVDEGEDTADKTYAKFGKIIALTQTNGMAYLIFDSKMKGTIDPMYDGPEKQPLEARTIEDLARKISISPKKLSATIKKFNNAVRMGKASELYPPKSGFAKPIETPPFYAHAVTGGMTFTFGGIRISSKGEVLSPTMKVVPGVYAAGEVTGGFFYNNYPAGSSLTRCVVFGQIAGKEAARYATGTES